MQQNKEKANNTVEETADKAISEKRGSNQKSKRYSSRTRSAPHASRVNVRYALDNLERAILFELTQDGRKPYQQIARELGVDEKTVRNRVAKLRNNDLLNIIPTAQAHRLQDCIVAIVALNVSIPARKSVEELADDIASLPQVSWVGVTMGHYDMFAEVVVGSWEDLTEFEYFTLPNMPGVEKTDSFLVLTHAGNRGVPFVESMLEQK